MTRRDFDVVIIGGGIVGSYLAHLLHERRFDVALVEKGPASLSQRATPYPPLTFAKRPHRGAIEARNHVLGGNGHFWGGGLIRNDPDSLAKCLGLSTEANDEWSLDMNYAAVEKSLGLRRAPSRAHNSRPGWIDSEIFVLPGRARNLPMKALALLRNNRRSEIFEEHSVRRFILGDAGHRLTALETIRGDEVITIGATHFIIAAGAIDSILLVSQLIAESGAGFRQDVGKALHDHISVPLFEIVGGDQSALRAAIAPRFEDNLVLGVRYETELEGEWNPKAFLHFQFQFDLAPPYKDIKQLLAMLQQRESFGALVRSCARCAAHPATLAAIGLRRYFSRRLYIAPNVPLVATLDFEAIPSIDNALSCQANPVILDWDIRAQDERAFVQLFQRCEQFLSGFVAQYGAALVPKGHFLNGSSLVEHLHRTGIDAFHLGGGISVGLADIAATIDERLRLPHFDNVSVVSGAAMKRPGIANPTLTLLALADRLARGLRR